MSALNTALNKDPRDVILKPVVSEKSYGLIDEGKYTFLVDPRADKTEIKLAVEKIFGVKVASVNTINRVGKARRTRFGTGRRKDTKRAIVTLRLRGASPGAPSSILFWLAQAATSRSTPTFCFWLTERQKAQYNLGSTIWLR